MKREINLYTCVLMLLGLYALYIFIHQFTLPIPLYAWYITALGIPFSILPFRLPSGVTWSGAVVIYVYLESLYGCHLSLFAMIITTSVAFVITAKKRAFVQWTRLLATYGMYGLSIAASVGVVHLCAWCHIFHVVTSLFGVAVYEIVNLLLFLGIQRSMGRTKAFSKIYTHIRYYPILFGSVVLAHLQSFTQPTTRFEESAWSAFLLFLFVIVSNGYARVDRLRKDGEKKYRIIANYTSDLICVLDQNGVVTYASPSHQATLGMSPQSMEGRAFMDTMNVTDAILLKAAFEAATRYRVAQRIELHSRDSLSYFNSQISPVIESDGSVKSFVIVSRDMTEQRRTERLLRRSDRLALVGQLAAGIAHEIRNPLTSLKGFLQLFQPKLADKPIQYRVMWSELERIEEIIKEFLVLAKPASKEDTTSENLYELILEVTRLLEAQANLSNVEMKLEENLSVPTVYCHPNQLKQVFVNLMKNSIEAMPQGGKLNIRVENESDSYVTIVFEDTGVGISKERLASLGEPFYTTKEKGTGLGLMVTYKIVEDHGGEIQIDSELNQGTRTKIRLPKSFSKSVHEMLAGRDEL